MMKTVAITETRMNLQRAYLTGRPDSKYDFIGFFSSLGTFPTVCGR
jgi:hypothetical protein